MKKVQSVLGDHQDAVIARQVERELGISAHLAGENAFSYGLLYGRDVCDGQRLQARARRTWKRASSLPVLDALGKQLAGGIRLARAP